MARTAEILLEYQNVIPRAPVPPGSLMHQASSNDGATVGHWRDQWIGQARANKAQVGSFKENGIGKLHGQYQHLPVIIAGSGPSLAVNGDQLKDRGQIPLISCLHNFHFFEDRDITPDFYVSLDAGPVVLEEIAEGGKLTPDEYWARTEGKTLLAYVGSHPDLIKKWRGKIYFFNCPVPDQATRDGIDEIEKFRTCVVSGGNVLGACFYIAKAIFGAGAIAFTGADFSFSYKNQFHGWHSKYDKTLGYCIPQTDIYGVRVKTWQSYANFKAWFDHICETVPGIYFNCSEGGCLGSYPEGNISSLRYLDLKGFFEIYQAFGVTKNQCVNPETDVVNILF